MLTMYLFTLLGARPAETRNRDIWPRVVYISKWESSYLDDKAVNYYIRNDKENAEK